MSEKINTIFVFTGVSLAEWDADRDLRKSSTHRLMQGWSRIRPFITGCVSGSDPSAGHLTAYLSMTCGCPYRNVSEFSADVLCPDPTEMHAASAGKKAVTDACTTFVALPDLTLVIAHMQLVQALGRSNVLPHRFYVMRIERAVITTIGLVGDDGDIGFDELLHTIDPALAAKHAAEAESVGTLPSGMIL